MPGKQAKILSDQNVSELLAYASTSRHPERNTAIVLLSLKAGLRAGEIAKLTWEMVIEPNGKIGRSLELLDKAAKKFSGRRIPLHDTLRHALADLQPDPHKRSGPIIRSERGRGRMQAGSVVLWFYVAYRKTRLEGCSSHSGRRTFITRAARLVHKTGGSLRDVQLLAGHSSIQTTQSYIDGDTDAQRRLVALL